MRAVILSMQVISLCDERSVEGLAWLGKRLFSVGLQGYVEEYDLASLQIKVTHTFVCIKKTKKSNVGLACAVVCALE
jgi:hypothetical protein